MSLTLAIPTLNQYHLLENCIRSALSGTLIPDTIFIVDNGPGLPQSVRELCGDRLIYYTEYKNLGVAKSWNFILQVHKEHPILIANDDLEFGKNDLKNYYTSFNSDLKDVGLYYPNNISHLNMFSAFIINPLVFEAVGYFDENFYPAYFEDNDYARRLFLKGYEFVPVLTEIKHMGSATVRSLKGDQLVAHHQAFNRNRQYYISKWGGVPHAETFLTPFNK